MIICTYIHTYIHQVHTFCTLICSFTLKDKMEKRQHRIHVRSAFPVPWKCKINSPIIESWRKLGDMEKIAQFHFYLLRSKMSKNISRAEGEGFCRENISPLNLDALLWERSNNIYVHMHVCTLNACVYLPHHKPQLPSHARRSYTHTQLHT